MLRICRLKWFSCPTVVRSHSDSGRCVGGRGAGNAVNGMLRSVSVVGLFVLLLLTGRDVRGQISYLRQFPELNAWESITRVTAGGDTVVTCGRYGDKRSFFVVEAGGVSKYFYTSPVSSALPYNYAYEVEDIRLQNGVCYFCGHRWKQLNELIYDPFGNAAFEPPEYIGILGRFTVADVLSGTGSMSLVFVEGTRNISKLATYPGGLLAVGESDTGQSILLEMEDHYPAASSITIAQSSVSDEVFVNVVNANGRIVTLSRYNNPVHFFYYRDYFTLRYGVPGSFFSTGNMVNHYDTYFLFTDSSHFFKDCAPMPMASTQVGEGVVLGHFVRAETLAKGHFILYHIPSEGWGDVEVVWNRDSMSYDAFLDMDVCASASGHPYVSLLLTDHDGCPHLRFPYLNRFGSYYDTTLYSCMTRLKSVASYPTSGNGMHIMASGFDPYLGSKLVHGLQKNVHVHDAMWGSSSCFGILSNEIRSFRPHVDVIRRTEHLILDHRLEVSFTDYPFTSEATKILTKCQNGQNQQ